MLIKVELGSIMNSIRLVNVVECDSAHANKTGIFRGHVIFLVFTVSIQFAKINYHDLDRVAKIAEKR